MIELRSTLYALLITLHSRVYFQVAPVGATFPYIVYDIPNTYPDGEGYELATIDIDGWDSNDTGDSTAIETMMATVNAGLNKHIVSNADVGGVLYLENKIPLTDPEPKIFRRKYTYTAKIFKLKE